MEINTICGQCLHVCVCDVICVSEMFIVCSDERRKMTRRINDVDTFHLIFSNDLFPSYMRIDWPWDLNLWAYAIVNCVIQRIVLDSPKPIVYRYWEAIKMIFRGRTMLIPHTYRFLYGFSIVTVVAAAAAALVIFNYNCWIDTIHMFVENHKNSLNCDRYTPRFTLRFTYWRTQNQNQIESAPWTVNTLEQWNLWIWAMRSMSRHTNYLLLYTRQLNILKCNWLTLLYVHANVVMPIWIE